MWHSVQEPCPSIDIQIIQGIQIKGTVNIISNDHIFRKWHVKFSVVFFKPPPEQQCRRFCLSTLFYSYNLFIFEQGLKRYRCKTDKSVCSLHSPLNPTIYTARVLQILLFIRPEYCKSHYLYGQSTATQRDLVEGALEAKIYMYSRDYN